MEKEVRQNILPFWMGLADPVSGGYWGEADFNGQPHKRADKGCIMHSRILWTFSAAYRLFQDKRYKEATLRARNFITDAFWDEKHGGLYWQVDYIGIPVDTTKHFYNIAFGIYALSEHYRATGDRESLNLALDLFEMTEKYGYDTHAGGYIEARTDSWAEKEDYRLSVGNINSAKTMNTNLHILEAYTNLLRACGNSAQGNPVRRALTGLLKITTEKIINKTHHFDLFFDMDWKPLTQEISYGHDIEGSWLLYDAALALGGDYPASIKDTTLAVAAVTLNNAIDSHYGGLYGGADGTGKVYQKKEWWPQAEAAVGFYNAWTLSGDAAYYNAAAGLWDFIDRYFADRQQGEWHNELSMTQVPDTNMPKAGFWKCPYHNSRMCFQLWERMDS